LLTLTGVGGVGKTRLALRVAEEARADFTHGAIFVSLATVSDPTLVVGTIGHALGVREDGGRSPHENVTDYLRDKHLLLVLDNAEQVTAAGPSLLLLLASCAGLTILVTSRSPLRVRGEQQFAAPPLALPARSLLLGPEDASRFAAIALFLARAREVKPDFTLTEENVGVVVALCHALDGLPLALELAAARLKVLPPEALRMRLADRLAVLTDGPRDLPVRQQTLRALLAWSYDLLDDGAQSLFRRLAVFAGSWTLDAAETVGTGDSLSGQGMLDKLTTLADESLVQQTPPRPTAGGDEEPSFTMLETVKAYALDHLSVSGEEEAVRRAHARYYHDHMETTLGAMDGSQMEPWLARLDRDGDNLRAALGWALDQRETALGLALAGGLRPFWQTRGYLSEGSGWIERFLTLDDRDQAPLPVRARACGALAVLSRLRNEFDRAVECAQQGVEMYEALHDAAGVAECLNVIGGVHYERGEYGAAAAVYKRTLSLYEEQDDVGGMARALNNLGAVAQCQGDVVHAIALYEQSLDARRVLGNNVDIATTLHNIGVLALEQEDFVRAGSLLMESLRRRTALGDKVGRGHSLGYRWGLLI